MAFKKSSQSLPYIYENPQTLAGSFEQNSKNNPTSPGLKLESHNYFCDQLKSTKKVLKYKTELQNILDYKKFQHPKKKEQPTSSQKKRIKFLKNIPEYYMGANLNNTMTIRYSFTKDLEKYNKTIKFVDEIEVLKLSKETYYNDYEQELINSIKNSEPNQLQEKNLCKKNS